MELDQIVDALARMGVVLELQGANPFKARAFSSAARTLKRLEGALELIDAGKIDTVKGIGKSLAADIAAMRSSGRFEAWPIPACHGTEGEHAQGGRHESPGRQSVCGAGRSVQQ